jgi:hypothetical protein
MPITGRSRLDVATHKAGSRTVVGQGEPQFVELLGAELTSDQVIVDRRPGTLVTTSFLRMGGVDPLLRTQPADPVAAVADPRAGSSSAMNR